MASSARIDELRKKFDENPRRYFAPLANEFRKAGDLEQAVFICQEYLPQQPGHMSGHIVYGQALFELGRDEEAKAVFETALSLDPENLIALRHLGDIARQAGDIDVARFWYQRVLESDPRNEEIAQILMSLDAARGESAPPVGQARADTAPALATPAPVEPSSAPPSWVESGEPLPASTGSTEPESYEPFEGFDRTIDFDQAASEPPVESETQLAADAVAEAPIVAEEPIIAGEHPGEQALASAHAGPDAEDLLDLDDFSIGGESIESAAAEVVPTPEAISSPPHELPPIEFSESGTPFETERPTEQMGELAGANASEDEVSSEDDGLTGTSRAAAAGEPEPQESQVVPANVFMPDAEPEPVIELASDIELGLPPDEPVVPTEVQPEPEPAEPARQSAMLSSIDEPVGVEPVGVEPVGVEPVAAPGAAAEGPDSTDEVFVTETMANLYVQQGHLASALEIYEKLAAGSPGDTRLQERVRDVKERIYGKHREAVWEPQAEPADVASAAPAAATEPSIRDFLRSVIARRLNEVASNGAAGEPDDEASSLQGAPPEIMPSETVTGSIDALFANATPSDEDRSAANALAQAFGEWPEPTPIRGVPAHEASSELSLDHVFKANAPVPRRDDPDSFSFDQFFSDELGEGSTGSENQPGRESAETSDDIAQFNAWLNGLKKT